MSRIIKAGTTDVSVIIRIIDSTDGTPETGVVFDTAGIDLEYRREGAASTDITEATLAALTTAHTDGGFLAVGNGYYRLDLPDAACAAGATGVLVHGVVTGMVVIGAYIELVAYDPYDTVRLGLTALPNAAAQAAGGLYTRGTGAGQINQPANGLIDVNVENWNTTAVPAEHTAGYPIVTVKDGTGTGELDTASGVVLAKDHAGANLATATALTTVDDFLDTEVAAILAAVDTEVAAIKTVTDALPNAGALTTIQSDLDDIQTRLPAALTTGTSDSGTTTTMVDAARTEADTDYWKGLWIRFTSGNISGQVRLITGFTPASDTITFAPATTQAVATQTYEILPANRVDIGQWLGSTPNALQSGRVDGYLGAGAADVITTSLLAADAVTEIQSGLATAAALDAVDNFVDTEIAAIITTLGTPAGASISADIAAIEAQTDDIGAAGAGLTAIPWNAAWDAEVQSEANDALVANNLDKLVIAAGTADSGTSSTMVDAARTEADADYWKGRLLLFTSGNISGQCAIITDFVVATDTFTFAPPLTQAVSTQTYVILPGVSIWDDTLAEHLISGSTGSALNAAGSAGDPWSTALPGAYGAGTAGKIIGDNVNATVSSRASQASVDTVDDFLDTEIAAIKAKTDNLPASPANEATLTTIAGYIDTEVAAIKAKTDNLPVAPAATGDIPTLAQINTEIDTALADINLDHLVKIAVDTDFPTTVHLNSVIGNLADNGTSASFDRTTDSLEALEGKINTVDDFLDTEVGAIKAVTDALPNAGALTTLQADLDDIQTRLPAALVSGRMDSNVQAMAADVITAAAIAADAIGSSELAASAVTEIQSGLSTLTTAQVNAEVVDALTIDTLADSYAADGAQPTIAQAILAIQQFLMEKSVSSTTVTVKKPNGVTQAMTFTLDSATTPTSITRAS